MSPQRRPREHHGGYGTPEYDAWAAMVARCTRDTHPDYPRYGGRGITVCTAWRDSFAAFHRDMGNRPSPNHSLDRIDNSAGYSPENCRWATKVQQQRNTRNGSVAPEIVRAVREDQRTHREIAAAYGLGSHSIVGRIKRGERYADIT